MNILAIGAHPDDLEFGCGGTLLKYARQGHQVYALVMTKGGVGGNPDVRTKEQEAAAQLLGVKEVFWGNYPDTELPLSKDIITFIEDIIRKVNPEIAFFNYYDDTHQDHRVLTRSCLSATRYTKEVLCYEVPSTQNFNPTIFVDIGDVLEQKLKLLECHASQVHKTQVPDLTILESARSCAIFRGFQGRVKFAEGFLPLRILRTI